MEPEAFERFQRIVYEQVGIALGPKKEALVKARVGKRMRALGIDDYEAYLDLIEGDDVGAELTLFLDAICTNVTAFYREAHHFDFVTAQMRACLAQGQRRFRFWSAACSTGEEPLTLAMTLLEATADIDVDVRILATDISTKALDRCLDGCYTADRLAAVPPILRERWFDEIRHGNTTMYRAKKELREIILFRRMNLSTPPFLMTGPLDAVFCRNVMIYFDKDVRRKLLDEVHRLLKPGGHLIVGHAESLTGIAGDFKYVQPAVYVRH